MSYDKKELTVAHFMQNTRIAPIERRILLSFVLNCSKETLIAHPEMVLSLQDIEKINHLFEKRAQGVPIAYLVGSKEFYGLNFLVNGDVLIPREETELLVDLALKHLKKDQTCLDVGTGSGAICVAISHKKPDVKVAACDISLNALKVAKHNALRLLPENNITFYESDCLTHIPKHLSFDVIVSNPPYIAKDDKHLNEGDLVFEPKIALTDDDDGLSIIKKIIAQARFYLKKEGYLMLEHGYLQHDAVCSALKEAGYFNIKSYRDLANIFRVCVAQYNG